MENKNPLKQINDIFYRKSNLRGNVQNIPYQLKELRNSSVYSNVVVLEKKFV